MLANDDRVPLRLVMPAPAYVRATIGNAAWWQHECGHVEEFVEDPKDGGCDACESGSPNAADWRPLYVLAGSR